MTLDIEKLKALALAAYRADERVVAFLTPGAALDLIAEVERLRAALAGAEKDADRYRWLREKSAGQWEHPIVVEQMRVGDRMQYIGPLSFGALDIGIDAAKAKEPPCGS